MHFQKSIISFLFLASQSKMPDLMCLLFVVVVVKIDKRLWKYLFFSRATRPILTNSKRGTKNPWVKANSDVLQWRELPFFKCSHPFHRKVNCKLDMISKNTFKTIINLLQNHKVNINKTWQKAYMDEGHSNLFKNTCRMI